MSASPISFIPAAPAHESQASAKPAGNDSGESFNQALTREISERRDASQPSDSARPAAPAAQKTADKTAKAGKDQSADDKDKDKDSDQADAADAAAGSTNMLAMMIDARQLSGKDAAPGKADASDGKPVIVDAEAIANATGKTLSAKSAAAADEKITGTQDKDEKATDTADARASSKTKNFADDLRTAGKDARQAVGDNARSETQAAVQNFADARMDALQKAASEHDRTLALQAAPASAASLISAQQAAGLHAGEAAASLAPQVGSPAWDRALGQKIVWMVAGDQQSASLTLNPPDLGPLQVVLNVTNSTADATFIAAQPEVRHALEQAMPKLREMMNEAGIQLGQANVSTGTPNGNQTPRDNFPSRTRSSDTGADASDGDAARIVRSQPIVSGQGLVDTFV